MCHHPTSSELSQWDEEFSSSYPQYFDPLEKQLQEWLSRRPNDIEILWRQMMLLYLKSLNLVDDDQIRSKTLEAFNIGRKATDLLESNPTVASETSVLAKFNLDKWFAICSGKLALLESDINEKVNYVQLHLKHLQKCLKLNPEDQMILFMQGRFQLAITLLSEDELNVLKKHLKNFPKISNKDAELFLKKSIELNSNHLDSYITLAYLLIKSNKLQDAKKLIDLGLKVPIVFKADEMIHKELLKIKDALEQKPNNDAGKTGEASEQAK